MKRALWSHLLGAIRWLRRSGPVERRRPWRATFLPAVETLEERSLPSGGPAAGVVPSVDPVEPPAGSAPAGVVQPDDQHIEIVGVPAATGNGSPNPSGGP